MRRFSLIISGVLFAIFIFLPISSSFLFLEKTSVVYETIAPEVEHASRVKSLAKQIIKSVLTPGKTAMVSASEEDLNGVMVFAARSIERFSGRINVEDKGMVVLLAFHVPHNPIGDYFNLKVYLSPSINGLKIHKVYLGKIKIPGRVAFLIMKTILNFMLGNQQGSEILDAIHVVDFRSKTVFVSFRPIPDLEERLTPFKERLKGFRDKVNPICNPAIVRIYYSKLVEVEQQIETGQTVSLARFMGPLFKLAKQRSSLSAPEEENRAAILALTVYAGDWWFEQLTGKLRTDKLNPIRRRSVKIVISGRRDLRLHFIISAGLKVVADSGVSFAAGEFKELLDAVSGGSGFSFVDLAADRAGVHFAEVATNRDGGAIRLQSVMAGRSQELLFFPDISNLPEGISQAKFERYFGNVESAGYRSLVEEIDHYILGLPAYGGSNKVQGSFNLRESLPLRSSMTP